MITGEECELCSFRSCFIRFYLFSPTHQWRRCPSSGPPPCARVCKSVQVTREAPVLQAPEGRLRKAMTQENSCPRVFYKDTHEHMEIEAGLRQPERENRYLRAAVLLTHAAKAAEHHPRLFPQVKELHFTTVWQHLFIADLISPNTWLFMHIRYALFNSAMKPKQESSTHLLIGYQTFPLNNYVLF